MTLDLAALAAWNARQQHAREAYYATGRPPGAETGCAACGRRTASRTGLCLTCRTHALPGVKPTEIPEENPAMTTEQVDLRDDQAMTAEEAASWLDVAPTTITPDLARLTGYASDYHMCTWLADVLREAGCSVVEYPGWKGRGRPRSSGSFTPRALMIHHDASAVGPSPAMARFIAEEGRPADGIPAPLSQLWVCAGCDDAHPVGTWHVLAAGRANHAGEGDGWGAIPAGDGNTCALGVETDNTTGEDTPAAMRESLVTGSAAILRFLRASSRDALCGHREYAPGRKIDPDDIDLDELRDDVTATRNRPLVPWPGHEHFTPGHQCKHGHVKRLENWLLALPEHKRSRHTASDTMTDWTAERVAAFNDAHGLDVDRVTWRTWRRLQHAARAAR